MSGTLPSSQPHRARSSPSTRRPVPSSSRAPGGPTASSPTRSSRPRRSCRVRAPRSGSCCATGRCRSASCSACCRPAAASSPINPGRGRDRTRDDIAELDLPVLCGQPADLADLVPDGLAAPPPSPPTTLGEPLVGREGHPRRWRRATRGGGADAHQRHHRPAEADRPHLRDARAGARRQPALRLDPRDAARSCAAASPSSTRRSSTSAASSACCRASPTAARSRSSRGSPSTAGSTRCAATGRPPPASCPPPCAWCSRPISTPPTWPASSRWCPAPRRSIPTTPTRSWRASACRCSAPTRRPSSAAASRAGT